MGEQSTQNGEKPAGLSGAAWAAVGTIGAALVAGVVTLITVYVPIGGPVVGTPAESSRPGMPTSFASPPAPSVAGGPASAPPATVPVPRSLLLDKFTGRWQGRCRRAGRPSP